MYLRGGIRKFDLPVLTHVKADTERRFDNARAVQEVQTCRTSMESQRGLEMIQDAAEEKKKWLHQEDEITEKWLPIVVHWKKKQKEGA